MAVTRGQLLAFFFIHMLSFYCILSSPASTSSAAPEVKGIPRWVQPRLRLLLAAGGRVHTVGVGDGRAAHATISAALANAPKGTGSFVVHVKAGTYAENIIITRPNVILVGDGEGLTIVTGARCNRTGYDTPSSATVAVSADAVGFMAQGLTIRNTAGRDVGPAVALRSAADMSVLFKCNIEGFQDTLYAEERRHFYGDCAISGTIDFVFGYAKAFIQRCQLLVRRPAPNQHNAITAQGRSSPVHASGFVFQGCRVIALPGEDLAGVETYLGRPSKTHAHVVFMESYIDAIIHPLGWVPWNKTNGTVPDTIFYAEYRNSGPGADVSHRVRWSGFRVIQDAGEAMLFAVEQFIDGAVWLPHFHVPFKLRL